DACERSPSSACRAATASRRMEGSRRRASRTMETISARCAGVNSAATASGVVAIRTSRTTALIKAFIDASLSSRSRGRATPPATADTSYQQPAGLTGMRAWLPRGQGLRLRAKSRRYQRPDNRPTSQAFGPLLSGANGTRLYLTHAVAADGEAV